MERDSFVFYKSFYDALCELDEKDQIILLHAICSYAINGEEPHIKGPLKAVFITIKPQIDKNNQRYENGKKGGAPKGNQNAKKTTENNQNQPNVNVNVNDTVNDNVNVSVNGVGSDDTDDSDGLYGVLENVRLARGEYEHIVSTYQRPKQLIDKVSRWLPNATNKHKKDHFALCLTFADNDDWPKKKKAEPPPEPIEVKDPLDPEEQEAKVQEMKARLNGAFASS